MKLAEIGILDVWNAAGGGPLRGRRGRAFWRDGDGFSVALDPAKDTWFDFRDGRGGGALALVETAVGCDRRTALQWLEANCGLDSARSRFPEGRRVWTHSRSRAEQTAEHVIHWHTALLRTLEKAKLTSFQHYLGHTDDQAERHWADACQRLFNAQQLVGSKLLGAYRHAVEHDSASVEGLICDARREVRSAVLYTALMVATIAASEVPQ
jgi:hypothetical protein